MKLVEACAVPRQRAIASLDARPCLLCRDLKPDDDVALELATNSLRINSAAAERDHTAVGVLQELADLGRLECPELLLAAVPEERDDGHPHLLLEQVVGLGRVQAGRPGRLGGLRLPRRHEADEDDGGLASRRGCRARPPAFLYPRHPIRSLYAANAPSASSM